MSASKPAKIDLNKVRISSPCPASWAQMKGDDRIRHCGDCKMNVYNVAGLTRPEAEALIERSLTGERICLRLSRRADGTLITKDCPTGRQIVVRKRWGLAALTAGLLSLLYSVARPIANGEAPVKILSGKVSVEEPVELMGDVAAPVAPIVETTEPVPEQRIPKGTPQPTPEE